MISSLSGTVLHTARATAVIAVGGVGFEVHLTAPHALSLRQGTAVTLSTHLQVREDALELYGFRTPDELSFFKELISVSGVGPRSAMGILTLGSVEEIRKAVGRGDVAYLTKVSGIGRKTAERVVVELKDKMSAGGRGSEAHGDALSDVIDALTSLGYRIEDARAAVRSIAPSASASTEEVLKQALHLLSKNNYKLKATS